MSIMSKSIIPDFYERKALGIDFYLLFVEYGLINKVIVNVRFLIAAAPDQFLNRYEKKMNRLFENYLIYRSREHYFLIVFTTQK